MPGTEVKTVYDMITHAVNNNDTRFHRRLDVTWLKEYVKQASDFNEIDPQTWKDYAEAVQGMVTRKRETEIDQAVRVLEGSVNGSDKDLVVAAIGRMHRELLNSLARCVMDAINQYTRSRYGEFDGRISKCFQTLVKEFWPDPFIGK